MERKTIQRRGSFFYARAFVKFAVTLSVIYAAAGAALAITAYAITDNLLAAAALFALVIALVAAMWAFYLAALWVFSRESRQGVEVVAEGIREMRDGREHAFIPWAGVKEIELAATLVAGASLRVKGNFSEIAVSNVDLVITRQMSIREMHRALGQSAQMRALLDELRAAAPHAALRMNRLARRRMKQQEATRPI